MNIHIDPRLTPSFSENNQQKTGASERKHNELRESTRELEAMYVFEMYKSMRSNIPEGGLIEKNQSTKIFQDMLDMEMARKTSKGKGMGLGEAMYNQLKEHLR